MSQDPVPISALGDIDPTPRPWSVSIRAADGTELVRLAEDADGRLDAEIPDPSRLTEAATRFADELAMLAGCRIVHEDPATSLHSLRYPL